MAFSDWHQVRPATAGENGVIVALDFESSRTEPGFRELSAHLDLPYAIAQPAVSALPVAPTGPAYVAALLAELHEAEVPVVGVFGYCASGALACSLASALGAGARRPRVVVVDPYRADSSMVYYQFLLAVQQFARMVGQEEQDHTQETALTLCRAADWAMIARELPLMYRRVAEAAFDPDDDVDIIDELSERYTAYLGYLLASRESGYQDSRSEDVAVLSTSYQVPEGFVGHSFQFDVKHADLIGLPAVADVVRQVFATTRQQ
ncbi:MAG TPA: hypothetical protein VF163_08345 [Micromonosporaceae bacterium]